MILTVTLNTSIDKLYTLDTYTPYTVMRVREVCNTAGGKGMNVSRVAAQLGETVTAMGFVGGHIGGYFESLITESRIRKAFTHVVSETRSCINGWDLSRGLSTEYLEPGAPVTADEVDRFMADFARELPQADAVTISGSMPKGVPADCYPRLIRMCREAGKPVLLDTAGETLRYAVAAQPTFIKPNAEELGQLLGYEPQGDEALMKSAMELKRTGIATVVVSLGARGALMVCDEGVYLGSPPRIKPKNTVGCGDSMVAGFSVGTVRGLAAQERLRLAVAVSAANALSMSTGGYAPEELEVILPKVAIQHLA
jgi:tagatose 6-phosphate kinase